MEREYFVEQHAKELGVASKKLNGLLEVYNRFIQKALGCESPYVAEDLKIAIMKSKGENEPDK